MKKIKHILKFIWFSDYRKLFKLRNKVRYEPGFVRLKKRIYFYVDGPSFAFTYTEIFYKQIYKFKTDNEFPFIIDCGANIGLSVIFFKTNYPNAKILAFEPNIKCFQHLKQNVESILNDDDILENKAVSDKEGVVEFYSEGSDASRIQPLKNIVPTKTESVTLSKLISKKVDFLKIDIEGEEINVLREIETKLHFVEKVFIEYHSFIETSQNLAEILLILERNNFRYYIEHIGVRSEFPFMKINQYLGMDLQLNIYSFK